jgi:hypothetical protein
MRLESLERREVLTTFGTPWPDARSLTVSFPTDDAQIGAYSNSLRQVLDQVADRKDWQEAVLRAFQTWAAETNLNIGLASDRGDHFGAVGLTQNDPRFGDFRIGAFPQLGVLANATPFQTNAGTWAGDVLINTQVNFFLNQWKPGTPLQIPAANEKGPAVELFSVLLHEVGNSLGLADVNRPGTVMHQTYLRPLGALTTVDRSAIRAMYGGERRDIYEPIANNARATATLIDQRPSDGGKVPVIRKGSLNTSRDVDFYRFVPVANQETVTIRLRANGISLLKSQLIVSDAQGRVLSEAKADSIFDNNIELDIGSLRDHRQLFVRVAGNGTDVFTIGDYELEIDYRAKAQQPINQPLVYDADAVDDDGSSRPYLPSEAVDQIFANAGLIDLERGINDTRALATRLQTTRGFNPNTRYETIGSLTNADVDFLVFRSPLQAAAAMSIHVESLGIAKATIHADILDRNGNRVRATATPTADGSVTFLVNAPTPNTDYFLRVSAKAQPVSTGNYVATVDFATDAIGVAVAANRETIASGVTTTTQPRWSRMEVYKTQLFRLDLNAQATTANAGVRITIYDAKRANVVHTIAASAGSPEVAFAWLQRGVYAILIEPLGRNGFIPPPVNYTLTAVGISDDQGPLPIDPTDPYGGSYPVPTDPYGGSDPWISPIPDPYGGATPFPFPSPLPNVPEPPYYEPPSQYIPWYEDPYYRFYFGHWMYG